MELLRGQAAIQAVTQLTQNQPLVAVAVNPAARRGAALEVMALASPQQAVVVDVVGTPQLATLLARDQPLAAYDAKRLHRSFWRRWQQGPARWACALIAEQLLLGGRDGSLEVSALAARHTLPVPPPEDGGIDALAAHATALLALVDKQGTLLKSLGMAHVSRIEAGAVACLAEMEHHGMPFDADAWVALAQQTDKDRLAVRQELEALFTAGGRDLFGGSRLNLDSDADLLQGLRAQGLTVANARRRTLGELPAPWGPTLVRYRTLSKLVSTYGQSFLEHVGPDGRVHPTFTQIGASTGRMACSSPNLQAMVRGSAHRACFHTQPERVLVTGDYAACELRILAEMSGDPVFADAFARGEDVHATVAQTMFGQPVSKTVNPHLRQRAKSVNFGLCYGMGAQGLAQTINCSQPEAAQLLSQYFRTFPRIREFLEGTARHALTRGYAQTLTGRRFYLSSLGEAARSPQAERIAKNMPIQGTNADITKLALALLRRHLPAQAWVVNCVHDEIVVECLANQAPEVEAIVREQMIASGKTILPTIGLAADIAVSTVWDK